MAVTIGIDLGGTNIKAALVNPKGHHMYPLIEPTGKASGYNFLLNQLKGIIGALTSLAPAFPLGVGIGVAGLMDRHNRRVIASPNLGLIKGRHLTRDLGTLADIPILMDNDANCMALGEGIAGAAKGKKDYIGVTLGTGVGGSIVSDGSFVRGHQGGGGEIGHVQIHHSGPICSCGSYGCLEAYIGRQAVHDYIERNFPRLKSYGLNEINKLAIAGDADAVEIFSYIARMLAVALSSLVNIFNPQMIVIGGGIAKAGDLLLEPLQAEIKRRSFRPYTRSLKVVTAMLGDWAGAIGAGVLAVEK